MPNRMTLYIGDKNLSSWSLRAWLALRAAETDFEEVVIPLDRPDTRSRLEAISPSAKVPVLRRGDLIVWESIAICEYVAELFPSALLWPIEASERAVARAVAAEMHAGFRALRSELPMNIAARVQKAPSDQAGEDIARILAIWADCRRRSGSSGPFLFGTFTIADAMYAPVVTRFETYGVKLSGIARAYADAILAWPPMAEWIRDARIA